jgi:hypothetical protein
VAIVASVPAEDQRALTFWFGFSAPSSICPHRELKEKENLHFPGSDGGSAGGNKLFVGRSHCFFLHTQIKKSNRKKE